MRKRDNGGVTIELPKDLENIDECIEYINYNKIQGIMIANDTHEKLNLDFLKKIACPQNITSLDVGNYFFNYDMLYRFTEINELDINSLNGEMIDLAYFPKLKYLSSDYIEAFVNLGIPKIEKFFGAWRTANCEKISEMQNLKILILLSCKGVSLNKLTKLVNLEVLSCTQCDIRDFKGIENFQKLEALGMSYCRSLNDITGISKLQNLKFLILENCPKITNVDELGKIKTLLKLGLENIKKCNLDFIYDMKSLRYLMLDNCRDFPSLQFINEMPNLVCLSISDTNILDGDLTPCKRLKFAFILDKRHYNLKCKDLPRDHKYGFYRPMELE